jgi:hypothetical protein
MENIKYDAKLVPNHNSYYVIVPKWLVKLWNLDKGSKINIQVKKP